MTASRRVAVVASEILGAPGVGGPGAADSLLALALGRHGHDVELLVAPGRGVGELSAEWRRRYEGANVRVRPLESPARVRPSFLGPTYAVFAALRDDPPDVVVADDWRGLAFASLRARELGQRFADTAFVVYCHGPARLLAEAARKVPDTLPRFGEEIAERACLELADAVVSPSAWLLDWMRRHRWPVPDTARVTQNLWQSTATGEPAKRARAGVPIRRLAFFGQLREGKGVHVLVEALRSLQDELVPGLEVLFLGRETPRWSVERTREALAGVSARGVGVRFETDLERSTALAELRQPGTLVVLPSLLENSPYAVAECLEHGIPFLAARVGGIPELVAAEDGSRVLFEPTPRALASRLGPVLREPVGPAPAAPARPPEASLAAWLELVRDVRARRLQRATPPPRLALVASSGEAAARADVLARRARSVEVEVVGPVSRAEAVESRTDDWIVFIDDDDFPDEHALDVLVAAQAASGADVVTAAVRPDDDPEALQLFLAEPRALGLVENQYGVFGLVRRSLAAAHAPAEAAGDPDWPLLARIALAGGRIVSSPEAIARHAGRPGTVADVPGEGLLVLEAFEALDPVELADLPQLTATLAAALARHEARRALDGAAPGGVFRRGLRVLRDEGVGGLADRVRKVGRRR